MNIVSAKQQVKDTGEAYLKRDDAGLFSIASVHQRPIFLVGAPGIGKTAIMEQVARELGIGIVSYSMTHHTRQSALGLPRIEHREFEGREYDASEYTMSEIIAAIYDYMERTGLREGILFLDEINCVSETLYPSMLQFLQFKTFGKHKVPEGWVIVCAGNPPEYNRSVHEFDIVTLDRLREIDVEPDYGAWKTYASEAGLHPAVTTFLEAKKDCFYKVESRPGGGKSFVTARGWEDLAKVISLYEEMGKPVNRDLFVQFLRDDDISDQFTVYYSLFEKYRSDYQVGSILSGTATPSIKDRAKAAPFDERVALLGLMLDTLSADCSKALDQEGVVVELRDLLRETKSEFLAGASIDEALNPRVAERERKLTRKIESSTASRKFIRKERLVINLLKGFAAQCMLEKATVGDVAFHAIERAYKSEVSKISPLVDAASERMDNAFGFIDETLGSREMLVFLAELTTRKPTTRFISHYGNEKYYEHNQELQVDAARMGLTERVSKLAEIDASLAEEREVGEPGAVGLRVGSKPKGEPGGVAGSAAAPSMGGVGGAATFSPAPSGKGDSQGTSPKKDIPAGALAKHYGGKQFEYGFASVCKMLLPREELKGKKVLDVCCRRGRGAYKLSSMVGDGGEVMGVDWSPSYIEEAKDGMARAWHESGLSHNNMEFRVAYPEDLIGAGIGSSVYDAIYVNNVITLFYNQEQAIREFGRILKPGGLLILETIFADRPRMDSVVDEARSIGNSVQAARTERENVAWLEAAGFEAPSVEESFEVEADRGYKEGHSVPKVAGDENVKFTAVSLYVRKKR